MATKRRARKTVKLYSLQHTPFDGRRIMFQTRKRAAWYIHRRGLDPRSWEIVHWSEGGNLGDYAQAAHNERHAGR